jgi:succinyl-CoA synthetase beta subunit
MEREQIVKATFKSKHLKQLTAIIEALRKAFGQENVNTLSPIFIYRAQIYVLDMDIRIPDTLLRYSKPSSNKPTEEER